MQGSQGQPTSSMQMEHTKAEHVVSHEIGLQRQSNTTCTLRSAHCTQCLFGVLHSLLLSVAGHIPLTFPACSSCEAHAQGLAVRPSCLWPPLSTAASAHLQPLSLSVTSASLTSLPVRSSKPFTTSGKSAVFCTPHPPNLVRPVNCPSTFCCTLQLWVGGFRVCGWVGGWAREPAALVSSQFPLRKNLM